METAIFVSAGYQEKPKAASLSEAYFELSGSPAPHSEVTKGRIRFVPSNKIQAPKYDVKNKIINVWVDEQNLNLTLEQMKHHHRYLWFAVYGTDYYYADFHTHL